MKKVNKKEIEKKLGFAMKHGNLDESEAIELLNNPEKAEEYLHRGEV